MRDSLGHRPRACQRSDAIVGRTPSVGRAIRPVRGRCGAGHSVDLIASIAPCAAAMSINNPAEPIMIRPRVARGFGPVSRLRAPPTARACRADRGSAPGLTNA